MLPCQHDPDGFEKRRSRPARLETAKEDMTGMAGRIIGPWHGGTKSPVAPETSVNELVRNLAATPVQVIDVREPEEWISGCIPGSVLMPMGEVWERHQELDPAIPVVTVCHSGVRSLFSAEELIAAGFADVRSLAGGIVVWVGAGQPVDL